MNRFLFLSSKIINPKYISHINLKPKKYEINLALTYPDGFIFFGSGFIDGSTYKYEVDEEKNPSDYKAVTEWLFYNNYTNKN
jgi:hypothetical protein